MLTWIYHFHLLSSRVFHTCDDRFASVNCLPSWTFNQFQSSKIWMEQKYAQQTIKEIPKEEGPAPTNLIMATDGTLFIRIKRTISINIADNSE